MRAMVYHGPGNFPDGYDVFARAGDSDGLKVVLSRG